MNQFIRKYPFVLELYSMIMWISNMTKVPLKEYMIVHDFKGQLENQMVLNYREQKEMKKKEKEQQQGWP